MRRMREDHLHRNYSDVNERPIRCRAKLIQPKAGMAARLAMIPSAYNGTSCPATAASNGGSSERSSEGCKSRDAQPSAVSVSALAWGSCVGIQAICSIKFQKEATLLYHIGYGRAAFKENFMNANVNYCSVIILLRQLVAAGHCTKKEANRIAARIAKKTGADLILSM